MSNKSTVPGTGIDLYNTAEWNRTTVADGKWLQNNTLKPLYDNELVLASAINSTSASLQGEVDDLKAATDVIDVVATYSSLESWSRSVTSADVIKVLHCEPVTADGETYSGQVYFRYDGPDTQTADPTKWIPFASLDPYYSESQINEMFNNTSAWIDTVSGNVLEHADTLDQNNRYWTENTVSANLHNEISTTSSTLDGKITGLRNEIATASGTLNPVAFTGSYNDLSDKPTIPTVNNGKLTISRNGTALGSFTANQSGLTGIDISVPTKTSQLVNDSFATVAFSGSYNDLSNKPSIPSAANDGTLTITQNGTSKGTFSANQSGNATISLTDTTYENKAATEGSPDVSLVTAGDKFDWNFAYRQVFKLTKYVTGSEATQGTAIELGEYSYGPGYRLRFTISIEDTTSDYTLGINIPFSTGTNQQWNGWLANTGNYEYCTKTEYRVGSSSPDFGVFGNNGTFPGIGQGKRIGDITIPRFSSGGIPIGMYRGKFLLSGYSDGVKSFVLDVDLCYKCASSGTVWWGYVSLLPNDMHA